MKFFLHLDVSLKEVFGDPSRQIQFGVLDAGCHAVAFELVKKNENLLLKLSFEDKVKLTFGK